MSWPFPILQNSDGWPMQLFVVYENPADAKPGYPFVVRRWEIVRGFNGEPLPERGVPREAMCGRTLEDVRSLVPPGQVLTMPPAGDDPCIREVWL